MMTKSVAEEAAMEVLFLLYNDTMAINLMDMRMGSKASLCL